MTEKPISEYTKEELEHEIVELEKRVFNPESYGLSFVHVDKIQTRLKLLYERWYSLPNKPIVDGKQELHSKYVLENESLRLTKSEGKWKVELIGLMDKAMKVRLECDEQGNPNKVYFSMRDYSSSALELKEHVMPIGIDTPEEIRPIPKPIKQEPPIEIKDYICIKCGYKNYYDTRESMICKICEQDQSKPLPKEEPKKKEGNLDKIKGIFKNEKK